MSTGIPIEKLLDEVFEKYISTPSKNTGTGTNARSLFKRNPSNVSKYLLTTLLRNEIAAALLDGMSANVNDVRTRTIELNKIIWEISNNGSKNSTEEDYLRQVHAILDWNKFLLPKNMVKNYFFTYSNGAGVAPDDIKYAISLIEKIVRENRYTKGLSTYLDQFKASPVKGDPLKNLIAMFKSLTMRTPSTSDAIVINSSLIFDTIEFMHRNMMPFSFLNRESLIGIHAASKKFPPHQSVKTFEGFTEWGEGNHGDPEINKKMHFLKHVLDAHPDRDHQKLDWIGECQRWWQVLNIQITRKDIESRIPQEIFKKVAYLFPADDGGSKLPHLKVEEFISLVNNKWPSDLQNFLEKNYLQKYSDKAMEVSRSLDEISVHTHFEKRFVFMKGMKGAFYIGGRFNKYGKLTLSTFHIAYPPTHKSNLGKDPTLPKDIDAFTFWFFIRPWKHGNASLNSSGNVMYQNHMPARFHSAKDPIALNEFASGGWSGQTPADSGSQPSTAQVARGREVDLA